MRQQRDKEERDRVIDDLAACGCDYAAVSNMHNIPITLLKKWKQRYAPHLVVNNPTPLPTPIERVVTQRYELSERADQLEQLASSLAADLIERIAELSTRETNLDKLSRALDSTAAVLDKLSTTSDKSTSSVADIRHVIFQINNSNS